MLGFMAERARLVKTIWAPPCRAPTGPLQSVADDIVTIEVQPVSYSQHYLGQLCRHTLPKQAILYQRVVVLERFPSSGKT
jgi:hypothetical protein